jgi:hypothetical protein
VLVRPLEALAIIELLGGAPIDDALTARLRGALTELRLDVARENGEPCRGEELNAHVRDVVRNVSGNLLPSLARLQLLS